MDLYLLARRPLEFQKEILQLTSMLPDDPVLENHQPGRMAHSNTSSSTIASTMLKIIFYRLSNRMDRFGDHKMVQLHDQFVVRLVEAVSRTNPELLLEVLRGDCMTTHAIKEAVYACAIREKSFDIISQSLQYGVDPNLPLRISAQHVIHFNIQRRGKSWLAWGVLPGEGTGLEQAALTCDIRLAEILLRAGANVNNSDSSRNFPDLLSICALISGNTAEATDVLKFAQLLVKHGAIIDPPDQQCANRRCKKHTSWLSPLSIAIGKRFNSLALFLMENGAYTDLADCYAKSARGSCQHSYSSCFLQALDMSYSPLQLASISENGEMIELLLEPILTYPMSPRAIHILKKLLVTSCAVGDLATASQILDLNLDLKSGWEPGISPLLATAWNPDTTIAERLLRIDGMLQTMPGLGLIHVAARHGVAVLVQQLIENGADCNALFEPEGFYETGTLMWLILSKPNPLSLTPLHLAIMSGNTDTIMLLLSTSNLVGGELVEAVSRGQDNIVNALVSRGASLLDVDRNGKTVLDAAVQADNLRMISRYFDSGGRYRSTALCIATEAALRSGDYSTVKLLAGMRPNGLIDRYEASCLVIAINHCEWGLVDLLLGDPFLPGKTKSYVST